MTVVSNSERHPAESSPGAALRRRQRLRGTRRFVTPYVLLAPAILIYLIFTVYPIFRQFDISFTTGTYFRVPTIHFSVGRTTPPSFMMPSFVPPRSTPFSLSSLRFPSRWR